MSVAVYSILMSRKPNKPYKNENCRVQMLLPGNLVRQVDAAAERLTTDGATVTRTGVVRMALVKFLSKKKSS